MWRRPLLALRSQAGLVSVNALLLARGQPAVLTLRVRDLGALFSFSPQDWIRTDAPPIEIPAAREISWRLRALAPLSGLCRVKMGDATAEFRLTREREGASGSPWVRGTGGNGCCIPARSPRAPSNAYGLPLPPAPIGSKGSLSRPRQARGYWVFCPAASGSPKTIQSKSA